MSDVMEQALKDEIARLRARNAELVASWKHVDAIDWDYLLGLIPDNDGRGLFWRSVLNGHRAAMEHRSRK